MMNSEELKELAQGLIDAHGAITGHVRWRPRRAAKDLCQEFRELLARDDFWNEFQTTAAKLEDYQEESDKMLLDIKQLLTDEAKILARLGVDESESGNILSSVFDAVDIVQARTAEIAVPAIKNLKDRLAKATGLICESSRGPLLHALDFVASKKGAAVLAASGLCVANIWFAVAADGGALSHASMKVAASVANIHLEGIILLLG